MKQLSNETIGQLALTIPNPQGTPTEVGGPPGVPTGGLFTTGEDIIQLIINLLFVFGIVVALISVIYSGIQWIISTGEKQKLQNARNRLIYSLVGLIIIFIAFLIINFIFTLIGKELFVISND